ncbi:Bug family tripartite tricarboxylate transporter substrate binding protein [Rhizobium halophytocola]|uniref:Tripartite-type tricarboxylate transporter receptor subunit TctC n=1 Tax=Rhizobium halophytocola TaxID=735519 RepID=A0ABS4DUA9_9HYPH|nr:tripartite tricarboxylate transporter substrate-binding protein [Rhizobium halophytocola]MBP1849264.1 tripartite-type tricarboxylate transporter receptor subunit TctC [Rhizobium halophytocola]
MAPLILSIGFAVAGPAASAQAMADFTGKTITWTVPFPPGGGSGVIAQFLSPLLTKYLPGHPDVDIDYEPGSGSIKGTNQFAARAKPNGLNLLITTASTQFAYLLGDPRVRYDYKDWRILMAMPTNGVVYAAPDLGVTSANLADLAKHRLTFGNLGATSLDLVPLLGFRLLGLNVQHVFGYKGRADTRLAFSHGDVDIDYQTTAAYLNATPPLVDAPDAVPLFTWGVVDDKGNLARDPTFPDLPDFDEVYRTIKGHAPEGAEYEAYFAIFAAGFPAQKMVFVPKDTPDDVVKAYEDAFSAIRQDPDYQSQVESILGNYKLAVGPAAETLFAKGTTISKEGRAMVTSMLAREFGVKLGE